MCGPVVPLALMMVGLVCAVATPGWGPGVWHCPRLFASFAGVLGDADGGGAVGVILCRGCGGDYKGVVGDVAWYVVDEAGGGVDSAVGVGVAGVADGEGVTGVTWWLVCLVVV